MPFWRRELAGQSGGLGLSGPKLWACLVPSRVGKLSFQKDTALTQACSFLIPGFLLDLWVCSPQESGRAHAVMKPLILTYVSHLFSEEADVAFTSLRASGCNLPRVQCVGLMVGG